jgi:hypothetical protein
VVAMVKKETLSTGRGGAWVKPLQSEWAGNSSRPKPEEGVQLIHAFRSIKQAALREAIIRLVAELSEPDENGL